MNAKIYEYLITVLQEVLH